MPASAFGVDSQIVAQREKLKAAVELAIAPLEEFAQSLVHHEALLARDEEAFVEEFASNGGGEPPSLAQVEPHTFTTLLCVSHDTP